MVKENLNENLYYLKLEHIIGRSSYSCIMVQLLDS